MTRQKSDVFFLKILSTIECSLSELAGLVRDSLPVCLTHHEADGSFSIGLFLFFQIGPSHLGGEGATGTCHEQEIEHTDVVLLLNQYKTATERKMIQ